MQQPSPLDCAGGEHQAVDFGIVFPPDLFVLPALDDVLADDQAAAAAATEQQQVAVAQAGEEQQLAMAYDGQMFVFNSVQPQKLETIFSFLNGKEPAPSQSAKTHLTYLVGPIVVPENFDRPAALRRYRTKKTRRTRSVVKADHTCRREVALRMKRRRGRFVSSAKSPDDDSSRHELTSCTNCGKSSDATPRMRRGPDASATLAD